MAGAGQGSPGPRERNRQERSARIQGAARDLFSAQGYAATTTQQIADRAGLPIATLFRYARSKAELLILVTNDSFDASVRQGISAAAGHAEPEAACRALLAPVVRAGLSAPELTGHYQRELTFGATDDPGRAAGLRIVAELTGEL
ncbi:TetR/AcrR family transcriptional regulator, partial [Leucobacter sp. M11]|uniref:TetR/AcrR family transcriptional regulator n=1 Tax=Leucobacter sp. M11 TaxID=2993565 RepID=UPI002D7F2F7A